VFQAYSSYWPIGYLGQMAWATAWMAKYDPSYSGEANSYWSQCMQVNNIKYGEFTAGRGRRLRGPAAAGAVRGWGPAGVPFAGAALGGAVRGRAPLPARLRVPAARRVRRGRPPVATPPAVAAAAAGCDARTRAPMHAAPLRLGRARALRL
jgi:hypothetical protein